MKYKDIQFELPPLGEIIVTKHEEELWVSDKEKTIVYNVGCFILDYNIKDKKYEKKFISLYTNYSSYPPNEKYNWKYLPEFKDIVSNDLPIGKRIFVKDKLVRENLSLNSFADLYAFSSFIYVKDCPVRKEKIESWITFEDLFEDKE